MEATIILFLFTDLSVQHNIRCILFKTNDIHSFSMAYFTTKPLFPLLLLRSDLVIAAPALLISCPICICPYISGAYFAPSPQHVFSTLCTHMRVLETEGYM